MARAPRVFHPIDQCTMVYVRYGTGNVRMENTFGYKWSTTSVPDSATLLSLCTEIGSTLAERIRNMITSNITMFEVHARNMDVALGNQATAAFTPGTVGSLLSVPTALNICGNLVTRTGRAGYSQHGAKRISGFDGVSVNGNSISGTQMGRFANLATNVLATRVAGRFIPGVPHIVAPPGRGTIDVITFCGMLDSDIDSQKTRLNNHGS